MRLRQIAIGLLLAGVAWPGQAQPAAPDVEPGIPVTSALIRQACGACHQGDAQGRMTRISHVRMTPEGWEQTIRRMVLLNGVDLDPATAREAVRYLANRHGLAPEEARPAAFEVERRMVDHVYEPDPATQDTCTKCHSMGRVLSQRRTREEWQLLTAMHQGYYPLADFQSFYGREPAAPAPDGTTRYPVDEAVDHLSAAFPLTTPEWTAWSANMRPPRLAGTWALVGSQRGRGPVYGTVTITARSGAVDEFETEASYVYARSGDVVTRTGRAIVYTGFQWRGGSTTPGGDSLREVMFVERDRHEMSGRWFTGDHDEIGLDVTLTRVGPQLVVTGVYPAAVSIGSADASLRIFGAGFPDGLTASDIDFGPGLDVVEVVDATGTTAVVQVTVGDGISIGHRDLFLGRAFLRDALAVYEGVDRLQVTPETGIARVGGVVFPKRYEQFEARAYHDGPDGEAHTGDDLDLGMVEVEWSLEEYAAVFGDDDVRFVGSIDRDGRFTPAVDGPNPERGNNANNIGDVWVVATLAHQPDGQPLSRALRARAHLLVTVPIYIRRDPWAGAR